LNCGEGEFEIFDVPDIGERLSKSTMQGPRDSEASGYNSHRFSVSIGQVHPTLDKRDQHMPPTVRSAEPFEVLQALRRASPPRFIDVRSRSEYARGHAAGARSLPLGEITPQGLPRDGAVFVICETGVRAEQAVRKLERLGAAQPVMVAGGTRAWQAQGLPMAHPSRLWSVERQAQALVGIALLGVLAKSMLLHPGFFALAAMLLLGLAAGSETKRPRLARWLARMPWNRSAAPGSASA
jgi:rhodanese-related sulfurtransferase